MPVPFLDVHIQKKEVLLEMKKVISDLMDSGSFIGGPEVETFADQFGSYCGGRCVPVANGTDALALALRAMGIGPGDEVITVPFTFIATAEAVSMAGGTVRFVDIHPKNYTMDPALLEKTITPRTKAILPVHLFGQPADMDPLMEIAARHQCKVIEDAAQSHGAEYKGRKVGSIGDIGCFSFYPTKNLGGFGDGGAVVSRNQEWIEKVARLADHGRTERYAHAIEGMNSRLDSFQAAILKIKLRELDGQNEKRRTIAEKYNRVLHQSAFITAPYIEPYAKHVFHLYCVETSYRDLLLSFLKERGIGVGVYYPIPVHRQPAYAHLNLKNGSYPVSERLADRILSLPMYPTMSDTQIDEVCRALKEFSPNCRKG